MVEQRAPSDEMGIRVVAIRVAVRVRVAYPYQSLCIPIQYTYTMIYAFDLVVGFLGFPRFP